MGIAQTSQYFYGHGKLLLSAEYFVLDGAVALALPCKLGQTLRVDSANSNNLLWSSRDTSGQIWFEAAFDLHTLAIQSASDISTAERLQSVFRAIQTQRPDFFDRQKGLDIQTRLEFDRHWGLGSSSTLIFTLCQWAKVDPFLVQFNTFGGSGYDIAAAGALSPFFYKLGTPPEHWRASFDPLFKDQLYFIYLGKKQNSREGIARYRSKEKAKLQDLILQISQFSMSLATATDLGTFEAILSAHECMVASVLDLPRAKQLFFPDYWGEVKSLGAWGGDFVLATSDRSYEETKRYFNEKGHQVFLKYEELVY